MDAHRSWSLGMAALISILISLTAAVFHGAAPVRAEDATTPTPIAIDENTATVDVKLYTDEYRTQELNGAVTSTSKLYGAFSAYFRTGRRRRLAVTSPSISFPIPSPLTITTVATLWKVRRLPLPGLARGRSRTIRSSLRLTRRGLRITLRTSMLRQTSRFIFQIRTPDPAATCLSSFLQGIDRYSHQGRQGDGDVGSAGWEWVRRIRNSECGIARGRSE